MTTSAYIFHSPPPAELGMVTAADFDILANVGREIGTKYAAAGTLTSPEALDCEIAPDGRVSIITHYSYARWDGSLGSVEHTTQPTTVDEGRLVVNALAPFISAGRDWLHTNAPIFVTFHRAALNRTTAGVWHPDGTSAQEQFRGVLYYDALPTQFAVGSLVLDIFGTDPPTSNQLVELLSGPTIARGLSTENADLKLVEGPQPLRAVGITHEHLHRAAPSLFSLPDTRRSFLRLATIRPK